MDIVVWLRSLGLGKYEAVFRENEIDETVLPNLTAEDLKELGVTALGHRRKLLDAIAALRSDASGKSPSVDAATTANAPSAHHEDRAERRQVTVMFSDLVGSTVLSARMDPEDLREVISAYQKCVAETVSRFDGFVAKYMGDGVLVYFGYPQAHEDDAERAVRAGLDLVTSVSGLKTHAPLQTRVGIATGLVVVGDLIGSGASQEQAIVGETPNLAARVQGIAEPNTVVIAESTRKLVGNLFELQNLGAQDLKGIVGPVWAWAALRSSSVESRFDALHASGVTELVGREEELELLLRRWSKAKSGEGQVVLLSGEPGIGKSRLTAAFLERLATEPHTRLRYFCSPQHTDSAFFPIISQLERAAGFTHADTGQAKLDKLDAVLALASTSKDDAWLFGEMLSLPNDGRYQTLELAPQQRRQKTLEALTAQLEALSRSNPVLMIFEDVHWIDPTSLEALGRTVDRVKTLGVLLTITYRPEFEPPWIGRQYVTVLNINRLGDHEIAAMIHRVTGNKPLSGSIRQEIIERTDGIPLFIEEMTKAVLEPDGEETAQQAVSVIPSRSVAVPATLHASLMARLDRLGPAKEVAQIGAAIGREFTHALLAAVARKPEAELRSALDRVVRAQLLFRQGVSPNATYLFKHALVQDAAYGTLLREPRRALHARIAEAIEKQFTDIAESQPELLARHCTEAGLIEKAASLWGKAGQRSVERSALGEAVAQLTRALDQIGILPSTPALRRKQVRLQAALITPLVHVKGYTVPETKAAIEQARLLIEKAEALGEPPEDLLLLFSVLYGVFISSFGAFDGDALRDVTAHILELAERQTASFPRVIGHNFVAHSSMLSGELADGRAHFDQALALYDPDAHRHLATRFGEDQNVPSLVFRAWAAWLLGFPEAALCDADYALKSARATGQAGTLMFALLHSAEPLIHCGHYSRASAHLEELGALAEKKAARFWTINRTLASFLFAVTGQPSNAVEMITSGIAALRATGYTRSIPWWLSHLAVSHVDLDQLGDAQRCIGEALDAIEKTKERWCEAEAYRLAGGIALKSPEPDAAKAEAYFERALDVARQQQAKSWELRASMSFARLWRDQGKVSEARELLAPVYGWFTEGFDTLDLKEAKALLEELAA